MDPGHKTQRSRILKGARIGRAGAFVDSGIQCSLRQLLEFGYFHADPHPGNLLATPDGRLAFLDFGMMSEMPETARYAIIDHVVHLVNRDYVAMANDYYALEFLDESVDVSPIVPALEDFFDDVLQATVEELNFKTITDGLEGGVVQLSLQRPGLLRAHPSFTDCARRLGAHHGSKV